MNILGIETSGSLSSVAVQTPAGLFTVEAEPGAERSRYLLTDCHKAIQQAGLDIRNLDRIAVGIGPGSFTGVRLGVTAAKSLAWALEIEVGGIGTYQALAAWLAAERGGMQRIHVIGDARMNEFFVGIYAVREGLAEEKSLDLVHGNGLAAALDGAEVIAGPAAARHGELLAGLVPGAALLADCPVPPASYVISETVRIGRFGRPLENDIEPLYLKASEAERKKAIS